MSVIEVSTSAFADLFRGMFGPAAARAKSPEEMHWEDDGGPSHVDCEGYEHVLVGLDIAQPDDSTVIWRPIYR